jgi:hypothetical protein
MVGAALFQERVDFNNGVKLILKRATDNEKTDGAPVRRDGLGVNRSGTRVDRNHHTGDEVVARQPVVVVELIQPAITDSLRDLAAKHLAGWNVEGGRAACHYITGK